MMERRMKRKFHVRCEAGENLDVDQHIIICHFQKNK